MPLLTILFVDVVESTATKQAVSLGRDSRERDHAYLEQVQSPYFALVRQCCEAHSGKEVTTMGDAFYLTFEDPVEAVRCSVQVQKRLSESPISTPLGPLRVRIGIHSGFPEFFEGSWHGTDVDTAKRIEATATERQILLSARTYELVRQMADVEFHARGEFALKGMDRISLWEADWNGEGPRKTAVPPLVAVEPKKFALIGLSVFAVLLLIALVFAFWIRSPSVSQKRAEGEGNSAIGMKSRRSVAVFGFKNLTTQGVDWLSGALSDLLSTELAAGEQLRTIAGEDVARATADLSIPPMPSYSKDTLLKIRKILGSDFVIVGSYVAAGSHPADAIRLDVRLQDAASGEILAAFQEEGTVGALSDLLKKVAAELRAKLGVQEPTSAQSSQARAAAPANSEAMRLYSEGLMKLRTFDALSARDSLERAIAREPKLAVAHAALAQTWQILGYDLKAQDEAKEAFDLSANLSPEERRSIEGRYRQLASQWDQATVIYRSLWEVFQDEPNYALELAKVQTAAGKGQDALATVEELRKFPGMDEDPRVDLARAFAAESLSDVKQQQASAAVAAEKASKQGSRYLAAQAYWQECSALYALGELEKGVAACGQSAAAAPFALQITARTQTVLANILSAQGQTAEALEMRRQALETARKIGSQKDVIGALENLANLVDLQGNTKDARRYFDEAFRIAREIDDKQQLLKLENDFAADLYGDGDFGGAEELYRKSLATAREIGDRQGEAMALQNLSLVRMQMGDLSGAQQQIEQAISIQRAVGLQADLVNSLSSFGDIALTRGNFASAQKNYSDSLTLASNLHANAAIAASRASLATLALAEGKPTEAEALAREAAEEFQQEKLVDQQADARNTLARSLLKQGKLGDAQAQVDQAMNLSPQDRTVRISLAITAAKLKARSGNTSDARKDLDACMADAAKMKLVGTQFEIALAQAEILAATEPKSAVARLQSLNGEARSKGFLKIAADADRARQEITGKALHPG